MSSIHFEKGTHSLKTIYLLVKISERPRFIVFLLIVEFYVCVSSDVYYAVKAA